MKKWNEGVAALVAIVTSGGILGATFGLARLMQGHANSPTPVLAGNGKLGAPAGPLSGNAAQGRHLFLMNCAHCHGDDARGDEGPNLYDLHKSDARIRTVITSGIKGEMPSFAKKLNDNDVNALTSYLRTLRT
jgi:mono/diheme cytochrome c family protein